MFTLALVADDIPIRPEDFRDDHRDRLKRQIQLRFVDRVLPNVGLCIEFYNFVSIKDAIIYPGDGQQSCGEASVKVEFNLIVFQPLLDEWLVGCIDSSTTRGITVSLGFFQDVEIPSANLRTPYTFDEVHGTWVWLYHDEESKETTNFFYEKGELIRFRVTAINFPDASWPKERRLRQPMSIIGAVDRDGLGLLSWWPH
ncbi:POLR3H [Symbiodinium natans]|uniref:POLR3H protein n=1 Tax=Symbiodinium natans TaxID=878477 RepID=A0A812TJV5_9DINO|nr:POLR3H [Symbiodinium natans]